MKGEADRNKESNKSKATNNYQFNTITQKTTTSVKSNNAVMTKVNVTERDINRKKMKL